MKGFRFAWTLLVFFIWSCNQTPSVTNPKEFSGIAMTIQYRILVGNSVDNHQRAKIENIIQNTFKEIDAIYNKWNLNSELSKLNHLPANTPFKLSKELLSFFRETDKLVKMTNGLFDPTIEPLMQLWKKYLEIGKTPSSDEIELIKPCLGWDKLTFKADYCVKLDSRTQIDLGGIAKGFCVDLLVERLNFLGFNNLYVEWGGEIRTTGVHPSGRLWTIYISKLGDPDPEQALSVFNLKDQAIATSGDYFQYWNVVDEEDKKKTYCHVFNPKTLKPVEVKAGSIASASLVANNCLTADALAKVLMMFDSAEKAQALVKSIQGENPEIGCWIAVRDF